MDAEHKLIDKDTWDLKSGLRLMVKEYNTRMHSTIRMTPNEAYYQKFITTKTVRSCTAEIIRARVVSNTKLLGSRLNKNCVNDMAVGDRVIVKNTMRIKIRPDGTRLIIPAAENQRTLRVGFPAYIHKIIGNGFNLRWG